MYIYIFKYIKTCGFDNQSSKTNIILYSNFTVFCHFCITVDSAPLNMKLIKCTNCRKLNEFNTCIIEHNTHFSH